MANSAHIKWTPQQRQAIETTGVNLLVSAAAGSGKTAVLAERCAHLVCDAPQPCDVDELLVVTFTNAAADEMRTRIESALRKRLSGAGDDRLTGQLLLLPRAHISTIHGFCTAMLRQHFHVLGIDPHFRVLDEEEAMLLRLDTARQMFDQQYETDSTGLFQQFVDAYGNGRDEPILDRVLRLHDLMSSVVDPESWLQRAVDRLREAADGAKLSRTELGAQLIALMRAWLDDLHRRWVMASRQIAAIGGLEPYLEYIGQLDASVESWKHALGDGDLDELSSAVRGFQPPRLPTIRNAPPQKDWAQTLIESIRDQMKKGSMLALCGFTEQQWRDGLVRTLPAAKVLVDLVRDFARRFAQAKAELRSLDFADLERFALRALRSSDAGGELHPSDVARSYHRRFKHVLVDEYQDINEVQDAILHLVSREAQPSASANLFCVGDVKQSIYRFRLAQPKRFMDRHQAFSATADARGQAIELPQNFRSRAPLLDAVNAFFERLMTQQAAEIEYDHGHRLVPGASFPPSGQLNCFGGAPVELHLLPAKSRNGDAGASPLELDRIEREATFIALRIRQLMSAAEASRVHVAEKLLNGALRLRPLQYRDIVILLRSMKFKGQKLTSVLRAAGVPVHSETGSGFFDSTEIRDMIALLRVLDNQRQDVPLAAILRGPLVDLTDPEDSLARIRLAYNDANHPVPFHRAVVMYAQEKHDSLAKQLAAILDDLHKWRQMAHQRPLAEVLWHIYTQTGYLTFCAGLADGEQRVANLIELHDRARQFGSFQRQGLGQFMKFLQALQDQADLGQPPVASPADNVVRVMSVHRAKGLEFPVVFVADLGSKHNLSDASEAILADRDAYIGLSVVDEHRLVRYPSLAHVLVQEQMRRHTLAEELRVLYVAMTRAREHLILVGTCAEDELENWRAQWAWHVGPLPAERVLGAQRMIDWIGPAAAAIEAQAATPLVVVSSYSRDQLNDWAIAADRRFKPTEQQQAMAQLQPLAPPPAMHPDAQVVIDRLTAGYRHHALTTEPAVLSVGTITKHGRWAGGGESPSFQPVVAFDAELRMPACASESPSPPATEIGLATHLALRRLDLSGRLDRTDVAAQIDGLIGKRHLTPFLAAHVDVDAILWLLETDLGRLLRRHAGIVRRELPVYFVQQPLDATPEDPMDRVMVRGRLDVLIPLPDGAVVIDYKTDRVTAQTVDDRADFYRPQVRAYCGAMAAIIGKPVRSAHLVFLAPRIIRHL